MPGKLPIGIQSFEKLRSEKFVYVDKTEYIYQLVRNTVPYFLSRPRRFGKSLLLSTLRSYWEGKKELFRGLKINKLLAGKKDVWKPYPVFYFDFNGANYSDKHALEDVLDIHLKRLEKQYEVQEKDGLLSERFQNLLVKARKVTGRRVVVLVDEYDKPLLDVIDKPELEERNKEIFKGFFSSLKSYDEYLQFVFITGVTRFNKVSIFSDLNQLNDISLNREFDALCGITEYEVHQYFNDEVEMLAQRQSLTKDVCLLALKQKYDGYTFCPGGTEVYNPFSLLKSFYEYAFGSYWFETGTPTFLVKKLKETEFDVRKLSDKTLYANESTLSNYQADNSNPIPLLYQSGYLTIVDYDAVDHVFTLAFPNEEVKYGFLENLLPEYSPASVVGSGNDVFTLRKYVEQGDCDKIMLVLQSLFASITYTRTGDIFEHYFQMVIYLVFTLLGKFAQCELQMFDGRIDCVLKTKDFIYVFEFKCDTTASVALEQIESKDYALPFVADDKDLYKIGVAFDSKTRKLVDWVIEGCIKVAE